LVLLHEGLELLCIGHHFARPAWRLSYPLNSAEGKTLA
jgi:hypothetical protein